MSMRRAALIAALAILTRPHASGEATTIVTVLGAYVSYDADARTWTIGNADLAYTIGLATDGQLRPIELKHRRVKAPLAIATEPDTVITAGGRPVTLGAAAAFDNFTATALPHGVRLDVIFTSRTPALRVTRSYVCYSGAAVIETWSTFTAAADVTLGGLNAWQMTVPNATLRLLTGLQSDDADNADPTLSKQFTIVRSDVAGRLEIGAQGRSSEAYVPWLVVEEPGAAFFGGLMWSGAWTLTAERTGSSLHIRIGLPGTTTTATAGGSVEAPHGFFGFSPRADGSVSGAMAQFAVSIHGQRGFAPRVTYNTWFAYSTEVDDASMHEAIDGAADVGSERFVLDAGWYTGAGRLGPQDFTSGLGSFGADPDRFPDGIRPLAEHAETRGLRFGLWVEPERVAMENVGRSGGPDERWLAMVNGRYDPGTTAPRAAQLCLGDARARQWIFDQLSRLIDEVRPSYIKWDNNFWINCNRAGHGHGTTDGNFAHVNGLYEVLRELRKRYPALEIENVSGGGNRIDFGMLQYTDSAWMDDRSAPSVIVRHNLEGLGAVFPPAYLLSFALDGADESLHGGRDLPLYLRSRMLGLMGLTFLPGELDEADRAQIVTQLDLYKQAARSLGASAGILLTEQASAAGPAWDAFESITPARDAVLFAFQDDGAVERVVVRPVGLRSALDYEVVSADAGSLGTATGAALMKDGIEIVASPATAAHVLFVTRVRRSGGG